MARENWIEQLAAKGIQGSVYNIDFDPLHKTYRIRLSIIKAPNQNPDLKPMIERVRNSLLSGSVEKEIPIVPFATKSGDGYYLIATDKELADKPTQPNNYKYILNSIVAAGNYMGFLSVFSNQRDENFMNEILDTFRSWKID